MTATLAYRPLEPDDWRGFQALRLQSIADFRRRCILPTPKKLA